MSGEVELTPGDCPPAASPPLPLGEAGRLADLYAAELVGTDREEAYDAIVRTAALVTGSDAALITLIDEHEQTAKACFGFDSTTVDRRDAFCAYAILEPQRTLHVPDTTLDARFRDNPYVVGEPHLRFYCGAPIVSAAGRAFGTLCVLGFEPRELDPRQLQALEDLAVQASALIQARTRVRQLEEQVERDGNAHIGVLRAINELVGQATNLDDLLEQSLEAIVQTLDLAAGGLWWHDGENLAVDPLWVDTTGELRGIQRAREGLAYPPEVIVHTRETATRHGADVLPTVVLSAMQEAGINGSHMIPIAVEATVVGAFELIPRATGEPSPRCLQAATQAGAEIGRWIERDRSPQWLADTTTLSAGHEREPILDPQQIRRRATIKARLAEAVMRGAITVAFDPIVRLADDALAGVEALARWHDEMLGTVGPNEFIPIAEEGETIRAPGVFVRRRALVELPRLSAADDARASLSLWTNIAAKELTDGFADAVLAELRTVGIDPRRLTLEVTERIALTPHDEASRQLAELHAHGVGIAIDDFGTGFTSLKQLRTLPLTHLKIDRSFITDLTGEHASRVTPIVSGIIQLGHSLGLDVVAEGIETESHLEIVRDLGVDLAQGHLLSRRAVISPT